MRIDGRTMTGSGPGRRRTLAVATPQSLRRGGHAERNVGARRYRERVLESFHPAVRAWFERRFPAGPTEPQAAGWREIAAGRHTLIAAPTGSGKTLAAFLVCIDRLYRAQDGARTTCTAGTRPGHCPDGRGDAGRAGPQVVYVSPLKALAADIQQNLEAPLREIAEVAGRLGLAAPDIRVAVRTGDTAAAERAAMLKHPPDILITTPESLYLLVTAERSRDMLRSARTVIVDEIHAVAGNKRGSHLALTLERLAHVAGGPVQRVGLSATQRPIETDRPAAGRRGPGPRPPGRDAAVRDRGLRPPRRLDLALELPDDELGAVPTTEQMAQILDLIAGQVTSHRTTLVFVNTRRMAERVAHQLGERLGEMEPGGRAPRLAVPGRRQRVEARLRAGDLRALVATASLELGIDVGPVELVCQIGSPRSFATFLQRVGRSNHTRTGTRPGGCTRPPGTSWSSAPRCCAGCAAGGWTRSSCRTGRWTSWPSRWWPSAPPRSGPRTSCSSWPGRRRRSATCRRGLRRRHRAARRGDPHRPRPPRLLPAPRPGERDGQGPARRPAGRADLGRGHPRARRLPGRGRAGRGPGRHRERGLGRGEQAGRRVPARHPLLADPPGRAGHGPGGGRARRAAVGAVLAGRGARPDQGAVRGGLRAAAGRRGPRARRGQGVARAGVRHRPGRGRHDRRLPGRRAGRARRAAHDGHHRAGAVLRRAAACSWSATRRTAPG